MFSFLAHTLELSIKLSDGADFEGVLWDISLVCREKVVSKPLLDTGESLRAHASSWWCLASFVATIMVLNLASRLIATYRADRLDGYIRARQILLA